jgi:GntR family transcriptional regulator
VVCLHFGVLVYYSINTQRQESAAVNDPSLFSVVAGSAEPIYRQLIAQVRRCVAGGQLKAGDELPSVRELAQALAVNPMTVSKAFGLMEAEGLLTRRRGLAMVVAEQHRRAQPSAERVELLRPTLERAAQEAQQLQLPTAQALALFKTILNEQQGE